jgi:hypothetical protein
MQLPLLTLWSISLWIATTAIILLISVQLISAYDGPATLLADTKRLKYAAIALGLLFLATVAVRIYEIIIST